MRGPTRSKENGLWSLFRRVQLHEVFRMSDPMKRRNKESSRHKPQAWLFVLSVANVAIRDGLGIGDLTRHETHARNINMQLPERVREPRCTMNPTS